MAGQEELLKKLLLRIAEHSVRATSGPAVCLQTLSQSDTLLNIILEC